MVKIVVNKYILLTLSGKNTNLPLDIVSEGQITT